MLLLCSWDYKRQLLQTTVLVVAHLNRKGKGNKAPADSSLFYFTYSLETALHSLPPLFSLFASIFHDQVTCKMEAEIYKISVNMKDFWWCLLLFFLPCLHSTVPHRNKGHCPIATSLPLCCAITASHRHRSPCEVSPDFSGASAYNKVGLLIPSFVDITLTVASCWFVLVSFLLNFVGPA